MDGSSIYLTGVISLLLLLACSQRQESEPESPSRNRHTEALVITNAWARPAAGQANSAAYMTIHNHTRQADTLIGVSSEAVALAEFHESYQKEGLASMRPADTLVIGPGSRLDLKPGGLHIMLMHVKQQLVAGDSLQLSLQFAGTGKKEVTAIVE